MMNRLNPKRTMIALIGISFIALTLSGCLYPRELRNGNQLSAEESVVIVQQAIDRYLEERGVLPIKNSTPETPVYEKYIIDFSKLVQFNYLSSIPPAAFEQGGNYYYLIIDELEDPKVKLMDLVSFQAVGDVQKAVDRYRKANGTLPSAGTAAPDFVWIDFKALRIKEPQIKSVYSGQLLNLVLHRSGQVFIDYSIDIMQRIKRKSNFTPDPKMDLRTILVDETSFVPVKSTAYYWKNNEPAITFE
jgi:hypothetical protein